MSFVKKFFTNLGSAPEAQYSAQVAAPSQITAASTLGAPAIVVEEKGKPVTSTWEQDPNHALPPRKEEKPKRSILDYAVKAAGSTWALAITFALVIAWAVWGIVDGPTDTWQVILQDVSSIQAYISATLLLRQQATSAKGTLNRLCTLISRSESNERMLRSLSPKRRADLKLNKHPMRADILASMQVKEGTFDKIANWVAKAVGSLSFLVIYWIGMIVWVVWGVPLMFSDTWQLYVNTATALEITLTTMFLQNIMCRHDDHLEEVIKTINLIDCDVEMQLRQMTGDRDDNPVVVSTPPKLTTWRKAIDIYAIIFGGPIGVVISVIVFGLWIAVGPVLEFDDNWFLIIGTYTGLMGFVDGFVMNNMAEREVLLSNIHTERLADQDYKLFGLLDIDMPQTLAPTKPSLQMRISDKIGSWCASTAASYVAVATVVILISIASAMQWTETGQLLCNTPTMIVEGFLLIILLQADTTAEEKRRVTYDDILKRRLMLEGHVAGSDDPEWILPELFNEKNRESMRGFITRGSVVFQNAV
ncbi:Low affinity iron permease [Massarina eburnea CBS 473.64]|uniref:Low affinity iron permease n=1 Tax=Massarina eburnea CBS 473.64 TaxID=1395130 RepID=A0A6A6S3K8_9PLEO|nr:Low affinity iron permease [Massarina eburnea CBS 473.64]